jgi:ketosteroid isomerase-like protein
MAHRLKVLIVAALMALVWAQALRAADDPETAIRSALETWRQDFNARKTERICELFAPELLYDFQSLPEQNYSLLCDRLHKALADKSKQFSYGLRIKEVIVSGPLAVVRLTWISTVTGADGVNHTDDEEGLDVFAKQSDGSWKIIRYIAYPAHPE